MPDDNASLWFYRNRLLGVILYSILYCQPHLQPTKLMALAGTISFPTERAQVKREGASKWPKLGVLADPLEMRPPFLTACRQCPLVLLPLDIAGNIKEKNCQNKAPVPAGLVAQTDGHKSLSRCACTLGRCASTLGMGWPWLLFSLEELHRRWPWCPVVRRNWGHRGEGRHRGKAIQHWGSPLESQEELGHADDRWWLCRDVLSRWCLILNAVARIPASLWHIHVGKLPYNPSHSAATKPAHFNQQVMPNTRS